MATWYVMTKAKAAELLKAMFPPNERRLLLAHPKFKKALKLATEDCLFELSDFGVKLLGELQCIDWSRGWRQGRLCLRQGRSKTNRCAGANLPRRSG